MLARTLTDEEREQARTEALELEAAELADIRAGDVQAWLYRYLPHIFKKAPGKFHLQMYEELRCMVQQLPIRQDENAEPELFDTVAHAWPRGFGKSSTLCTGFILYCIYEWRNLPHFQGQPPFVLLVSDSADQARDRCLDIRNEIEENLLLHQDYGDLAPTARDRLGLVDPETGMVRGRVKWTELDFTTRTGCRVRGSGSGGRLRGMLRRGRRPSLIVVDDLENDKHVETKGQRTKLRDWLTKALIPCGIEGEVITVVIGTIMHADSLLSRLLSPEHFPGWLKRRFAACYAEDGTPSMPQPVGAAVRALWPEGWSLERLLRRLRKISTVAFTQEYLNIAVDPESSPFAMRMLMRAVELGSGIPFLRRPAPRVPIDELTSTWDVNELRQRYGDAAYQVQVTAWDLALVDDAKKAREKDSDYTVGLTALLDLNERVQVRRIYRKRGMSPGELKNRVEREQDVLQSDYVAVENNQAQRLVEIELRGRGLPIIGHTTDRKKHDVYEGVPGMVLLFETDRMMLCARTPPERERIATLVAELHGLGQEAHDDMAMALWIAISVIRRWQRRRDKLRRRRIGARPEME